MKALVYYGPGKRAWEDVRDPVVNDPEDVVVQVDAFTICGTDLHILRGDVPEVEPAGCWVTRRSARSPRWVPGCARCSRRSRPDVVHQRLRPLPLLPGGPLRAVPGRRRWVLGHLIDGVQAESVRIPYADGSVHCPAEVSDEAALMLADILPTSYEVGALNGGVRRADTVVIIGAGPIGLAAIMSAGLYSPLRTSWWTRWRAAVPRRPPSGPTGPSPDDDVAGVVRELTGGTRRGRHDRGGRHPGDVRHGRRPGPARGRVANVGVHGKPTTLHLEDLWIKDVTITTGLVDTHSTPMLLAMLQAGWTSAGW